MGQCICSRLGWLNIAVKSDVKVGVTLGYVHLKTMNKSTLELNPGQVAGSLQGHKW